MLALVGGGLSRADDQPPADAAPSQRPPASLDQQLLEDLDRELLEDLRDDPSRPGSTLPAGAGRSAEPRGPSPAGEDIAQELSAQPLTRLGQRMLLVQQRMEERDTASGTQALQRQIVDEFAALIEDLQQQQHKRTGAAQSDPRATARAGSAAQRAGALPATAEGPARQSSDRVDPAQAARLTPEDRQSLVRSAWGHLPATVRQQVQGPGVERFLPKYERLIEEYYRRLAENPADAP